MWSALCVKCGYEFLLCPSRTADLLSCDLAFITAKPCQQMSSSQGPENYKLLMYINITVDIQFILDPHQTLDSISFSTSGLLVVH